MTVTIQDQVIAHKHLEDLIPPAVPNAEIHWRFTGAPFDLVISIQSNLAVAAKLEIPGGAEPCFLFLPINEDVRMNQLIRKMRNAEDRQQTICYDLVYAFMANDAAIGIIV